MPNIRPLIAAACICEKVLHERDDVVSLIRLVDTFKMTIPEIPEGMKPATQLTAFVSLKSGDLEGQYEITMAIRTPSGKVLQVPNKWPVLLKGGHQGANLVMKFGLPLVEFGLFYFDVIWEGDVLTSIPFMLEQLTEEPETK